VTKPLGEGEHYLDEVAALPPRWRLVLGGGSCVLSLGLVIAGGKWLLFPEMPLLDFALRTLIGVAGLPRSGFSSSGAASHYATRNLRRPAFAETANIRRRSRASPGRRPTTKETLNHHSKGRAPET
jgi:hypothetical protein